ncbi:MAG: zinc ribbon domain-containing protein [bacterium]|nr:zinc ribbon domain-containing protein [bacterium]
MGIMEEQRLLEKRYEKIKSIYEKIGKKFYEENKDSEPADTAYAELFAAIRQIDREEELQEIRKLMASGKRRCNSCQEIISLDSKFCNMCGAKLEALDIEEDGTAQAAKAEVRRCPNCGMELEADAVFCMNCGTKCQ